MGGIESEVTERSYTVYFHKKQSNIDFEVWDDNWEFVHEPNKASKKYLKDIGTSIEILLQNGQFNQHKAKKKKDRGREKQHSKEEKTKDS